MVQGALVNWDELYEHHRSDLNSGVRIDIRNVNDNWDELVLTATVTEDRGYSACLEPGSFDLMLRTTGETEYYPNAVIGPNGCRLTGNAWDVYVEEGTATHVDFDGWYDCIEAHP